MTQTRNHRSRLYPIRPRTMLALALGVIVTATATVIPEVFSAAPAATAADDDRLRLWYDEPAPTSTTPKAAGKTDWSWTDIEAGWQKWSLPLGNGYLGASVFGGTATERIQITENSLRHPYTPTDTQTKYNSGMNNFVETYVDFGHDTVSDYRRDLVLDDASAHVDYRVGDVEYSREYFASYPDKVLVMRFAASKPGELDFTLKPQIPYVKPYNRVPADGLAKTGTVTAVEDTITVAGTLSKYGIEYEGQYRVIPDGGTMSTAVVDGRGEISVSGANSATVLLAVGTNYAMEPRVFAASDSEKLAPYPNPHDKVSAIISAAAAKSFTQIREAHVADYTTYYDRVNLDIGGVPPTMTTDKLREGYDKSTSASDRAYLEELFFQYGRYLLISSSRKGALPANLQGVWNAYDSSPWGSGYWHNINVQMNYWPAFTTNLAEMFESYSDYNAAYLDDARANADEYIATVNPGALSPAGQNGWALGTQTTPYITNGPDPTTHSGPGTGAFTSLLFKDYVDATQDEEYLEQIAFPRMLEMARFLNKTLKQYGDAYLVEKSASPEQRVGSVHYRTTGTAFDQQMVYANLVGLLDYADRLGYSNAELDQFRATVDHLEPVLVGTSGQVKEYREESSYGQIGDPQHRHVSQLVGLFPASVINSETDAWMDAARVTLTKRGDGGTGWSKANKINLWARVKDGDHAHLMLQNLLNDSTLPNLWDTHPPFQIDGNFGATNGIAEMLLQSHEGAIEPLAALPAAWKTGSYSGLTARGGFTVDASWADGRATSFGVTSNAGGPVTVKHPGIATGAVQVTREGGGSVDVTVADRDSIRFDTVKGASYTIAAIPQEVFAPAPSGLAVSEYDPTTFAMTWKGSEGADSYEVLAAVGSSPTYEKIGTTTTPHFVYRSPAPISGGQVTFAVRSVAPSGAVTPATSTALVVPGTSGNLLAGKTVTSSQAPYNASFPITNINDGNQATRFAYKDNAGRLQITVDLGSGHDLTSLTLHEFVDTRTNFVSRVKAYTVEGTSDGATWRTIAQGAGLGTASAATPTVSKTIPVSESNVTKLRYTIDPLNTAFSPSFRELEATGKKVQQAQLLGLDTPTVEPGQKATLVGVGFGPKITEVELGGTPVGTFEIDPDGTRLIFTVPGLPDGTHDLVVTEAGKRLTSIPVVVHTVSRASVLERIDPATTPSAAPADIVLHGTGFTGATGLEASGVAVTGFEIVDDATIRARIPAHPAGQVPIRVIDPAGDSAVLPLAFVDRALLIEPTATPRCIGGKVVLTVHATNREMKPVDVRIVTPFGEKVVTGVAPGANATAALTTRLVELPAGVAAVTAAAAITGAAPTTTIEASFPAKSCR